MSWVVLKVRCKVCKYHWVAVCTDDTPRRKLECSNCGAQDSQARLVKNTD